jgi:hypothetical protein
VLVRDLLGTSDCYAIGRDEQEPDNLEEIWRDFLCKKGRIRGGSLLPEADMA